MFTPSPLSIPEQIALELAKDIMAGRYAEGERLIETDIAVHFAVSRGPVRDAFHLLERRHFIHIEPRKGAFVRAISIDSIADIFNVRTALFSTAARFMARLHTQESLKVLTWRVEMVRTLADDPDTSASKFLDSIIQIGEAVVWGSGSDLIAELLKELNQHSIWASLWITPLHFQTFDIRQQQAQYTALIGEAIQRGDADVAENAMRKMTEYNRDQVIGALAIIRNEKVNPSRML